MALPQKLRCWQFLDVQMRYSSSYSITSAKVCFARTSRSAPSMASFTAWYVPSSCIDVLFPAIPQRVAALSIQWLEVQSRMTEQEWLELLELEAPSILGVCHPAASVLDVSEPSFCWESSESESCEMELSPVASQADVSLCGYSPSPTRSPVDDIGFNLEVNLEAVPEQLSHLCEAENLAVAMLRQQMAAEAGLLRLMELLPMTM